MEESHEKELRGFMYIKTEEPQLSPALWGSALKLLHHGEEKPNR